MNLSDKELKFLLRFKKYTKRIYLNYFCGGLTLGLGLSLLTIGIKLNDKAASVGGICFMSIGFSTIVVSRVYKKLFNIILKLGPDVLER